MVITSSVFSPSWLTTPTQLSRILSCLREIPEIVEIQRIAAALSHFSRQFQIIREQEAAAVALRYAECDGVCESAIAEYGNVHGGLTLCVFFKEAVRYAAECFLKFLSVLPFQISAEVVDLGQDIGSREYRLEESNDFAQDIVVGFGVGLCAFEFPNEISVYGANAEYQEQVGIHEQPP